LRGANRELLVHAVRQRDVHGIHFAAGEQLVDVLVVEQLLDVVATSERAQLARVVRHQRREHAVLPGVRERGSTALWAM
jgi:hypothetical protein